MGYSVLHGHGHLFFGCAGMAKNRFRVVTQEQWLVLTYIPFETQLVGLHGREFHKNSENGVWAVNSDVVGENK